MKRYRRSIHIALIVAVFLSISLAIASIPTDRILDLIGTENAYALMFVLGAIGGLSTFVSIPYHLVLMSLASGGLHPVVLGVVTASGVMVGDSTMYMLCRNLEHSFSPRVQATLERISGFLAQHPRFVTPGLFIYGALSPFSNDFLVATMSLTRRPYMKTVLPLLVGNCLFHIGVAYLGLYSYSTIVSWF
jgi:uncharacterized membrane protein YdjX (TVP38/TMEM64 family)